MIVCNNNNNKYTTTLLTDSQASRKAHRTNNPPKVSAKHQSTNRKNQEHRATCCINHAWTNIKGIEGVRDEMTKWSNATFWHLLCLARYTRGRCLVRIVGACDNLSLINNSEYREYTWFDSNTDSLWLNSNPAYSRYSLSPIFRNLWSHYRYNKRSRATRWDLSLSLRVRQ